MSHGAIWGKHTMAELEDLVDQVADPTIRRQLSDAVRELKKHRRFGLVYERHIPETAGLRGLPIEVGSLVSPRVRAESTEAFRVVNVEDGKATLDVGDGEEEQHAVEDLLVVKRFGDPIYPTLRSVGRVEKVPGKPFHAVINGENYHALQLLVYLYAGQVDCIYIDPPYNTGARDWKYNNKYVDKNDTWRHSKWLSMMEKRLKLAKKLLKPDGILVITIDEHEVHNLGMLLDEPGLFPEYLRYMVTIVTNPKGNFKENFARVEEYALFCCPALGRDVVTGAPIDYLPSSDEIDLDPDADIGDDEDVEDEIAENVAANATAEEDEFEWQLARRRGNNSMRENRRNLFFPVYINEAERVAVKTGPPIPLDVDPDFSAVDGLRPIWPIDSQGRHRTWRFSWTSMQNEIDSGNIQLGAYNEERDSWTVNVKRPVKRLKKVKTVWRHKSHDAGTHGTSLLAKLLGEARLFPFPKSVYAVKDVIATVCRDRPEALVLDFFAGSGTTMHAVGLLNAEDDGARRSICVTNNEVAHTLTKELADRGYFPGDPEYEREGIFEKVTKPRCEAAVTGVRPDGSPVEGRYFGLNRPLSDGLMENVEFFELCYADRDEVDLGLHFQDVLPLLWLMAGAVGEIPVSIDNDMLIQEGLPFAVLFNDARASEFIKHLEEHPGITHVFFVTDSPEAFSEMRSQVGVTRRSSMLYRDYLSQFDTPG